MFRGFRRSLRIFFFFSRSVCFFPPFFSDCGNHQPIGFLPRREGNLLSFCSTPNQLRPQHSLLFGPLEAHEVLKEILSIVEKTPHAPPSLSLKQGWTLLASTCKAELSAHFGPLTPGVTQLWWPVFFCL